ncbi:GNAT family N-acetyltransferase [Haloarchaeobius litoreus]|uniref:GNAT family N-acetyltransferase n=1 Tax=Haloarchaeobius litoreus TaxID=755306 RepID=A0ABD6DMT1_9EURY|nr:GNAT family N-acetyltransferase [Haloarchaeobius litoreus]
MADRGPDPPRLDDSTHADVRIRTARPDEREGVAGVLDAAMLRTDELAAALDRGDVLVAAADDRLLGALVLVPGDVDPETDSSHVDAVAVRPNRRGQGIGRALVAAALDRGGADEHLTAAFDADVRPFYESLGFEIRERDGRLFGVR